MFENIGLAFQGIWSHKMRSFLTMLGIIIGIASIITIVSTIKGTNEQIKKNLIGSGTNVVNVSLTRDGYPIELAYEALPSGVGVVSEDDLEAICGLDGVESAAAYRKRAYAEGIFYGNTAFSGSLYGIDRHYFSTGSYSLTSGRGFIDSDYEAFRKVAIVDTQVASSLFGTESPVGQTIEILSEPFTVVGVVTQRIVNEPVINTLEDYYMYASSNGGTIFVPINAWDLIYRFDEPAMVSVRAVDTDHMAEAGTGAADLLNEALVSGETWQYKADNVLEQAANLQSLTESANSQLIWIAGISLLVGGIGVMNIMLVSVTERTREIGLKIAIGARARRIRGQFLTEAAVLTLLGGILGVGAGIGLAYMLSHVMGTPVAISIPACVIAVSFSTVIGVVFGLIPAVKASKLNPIEALRHE